MFEQNQQPAIFSLNLISQTKYINWQLTAVSNEFIAFLKMKYYDVPYKM